MPADTPPRQSSIPTIALAGFDFANISEARCVEYIVEQRLQDRGGWVITMNSDFLRQAHVHADIRALYRTADLVLADGMPVIWASRLQGTPLTEGRVCGSDLIRSLPAACARKGLSLFLLGGVGDVADRTESVLTRTYEGLRITGKYSPPFGFESKPEQYENMRRAISEAQPDVVLVALGAPKSERLIQQLRASAPKAWWMGVGASFEFISGYRRRAPVLMQRTGTEWLFRMLQDPKRMIRRYLLEDLPYLPRLFSTALKARFAKRSASSAGATRDSSTDSPRNSE